VRIAEGTDPRAFVQFVNLESKGKIRSFAAASTGPFGGDTKDLLTRGLIPFGVSKYATSSYVLELGPSLAPGEYSLSTTTSNTVFCFGIGKALN
ncbi:MAG: hypothetical protein JST65_21225, partial [Acidobacteria bacterium]|nr:hypothetical protein [Acidobacteriota bacterium]